MSSNPKQHFILVLSAVLSRVEFHLKFYSKLPRGYEDNGLPIQKIDPVFNMHLRKFTAKPRVEMVDVLNTMKSTILEYIDAIEKFDSREFRAFLLGVGFHWQPVEYWGKAELELLLQYLGRASYSAGRIFGSEMKDAQINIETKSYESLLSNMMTGEAMVSINQQLESTASVVKMMIDYI